jgi:hypothetical protein
MANPTSLKNTGSRSHPSPTRRGFLTAGLLGTAGLSLSQLLKHEALASDTHKHSRRPSVIILWMRGGPSHLDTWDLKPEAPAEYRGEFRPIETSVPGISIVEHLPRSAAIMHKWSIVRSLHHNDPGHSSGDQLLFTGYPTGRIPEENIHPSCGSVVSKQLGHQTPHLPAYVVIPKKLPGTESSYLGATHQPFETLVDPANAGPFKLPDFTLSQGLSLDRIRERKELLNGFDRLRREGDHTGTMNSIDDHTRQAMNILTSDAACNAFDLDSEPMIVRNAYGITTRFTPRAAAGGGLPGWNQRFLLARRMVEAGVRLVTVDARWWDTHSDNFYSLKTGFLPRWDQAFTALIDDLDSRELLESTLVVAWGEFGRSPKISADAGRDHYPFVFSAALAGGAIKGGRVVGASDSKGAFPTSDPHSPLDVLATIYQHLGIDTTLTYPDFTGRPHPVLPGGKPIAALV